MRFGIYSELQHWPGKPVETLYGEVLEQIVERGPARLRRLLDHRAPVLPQVLRVREPVRLLRGRGGADEAIHFRTMLHILPYHNPLVLASQIHEMAILTDGRYEFGVGRGHGWIPPAAGLPLDEENTRSLRGGGRAVHRGADEAGGRLPRQVVERGGHARRPVPRAATTASCSAAPRIRRTSSRRSTAGRSPCPPLLPYAALKEQLDLYRRRCADHGTTPDIIWIHACLHRRGRRPRAPRGGDAHAPLPRGQRVAARRAHARRPRTRSRRPATASTPPGSSSSSPQTPYDEMIDGDIVWVGTPEDVIQRVEETIEVCEGPGRDRDHDQSRRRRPLAGDQGAGAVRQARHPELPLRDAAGGGRWAPVAVCRLFRAAW